MIDLHCHLLPGVDDGPSDMDGSLAMARAHVDAGVRVVAATPHVVHGVPGGEGEPSMERRLAELRVALAEQRIDLAVVGGAEVDLLLAVRLSDDELWRLTLGDGPWLLVEAPLRRQAGVQRSVEGLVTRGHRVLLAHPERSPAFLREPAALRRLVERGVLTQVTADSFVGRFGSTVERFTRRMDGEDLVHVVASDAHDAHHRAPGLREQLVAAGLRERVQWLTEGVPGALLADEPVPAAPARRGRLAARLRGRLPLGPRGRVT